MFGKKKNEDQDCLTNVYREILGKSDKKNNDDEVLARLDKLEKKIDRILKINQREEAQMEKTQEAIDALVLKVDSVSGVVDSAVVLIEDLATQLRDAADDPEQILAIVDKLESDKVRLAAAVDANKPFDPSAN